MKRGERKAEKAPRKENAEKLKESGKTRRQGTEKQAGAQGASRRENTVKMRREQQPDNLTDGRLIHREREIPNPSLLKGSPFLREQRSDRLPVALIAAVCFLVVFGLVMIYSASNYSANARYGDSFYYVKRQLIGCLMGVAGMIAMSFFDYKKLIKFRYIALGLSLVLLALVFVPGVGVENYGAKRWIKLLPGFSPQPSEIAKFGFILFTAGYMAKNADKMRTFFGLLPPLAAGGSICVLILLEPNLSITICVGLLMLMMMFVGGMKAKHFLFLLVPIACLVPVLIIAEPYRLKRLAAFLDPWASPLGEGYQLIQSLYALGSGGLFGVGLFNSRQKLEFLPFAESDFIFSIIGEELGFFGGVLTILVYFVVIVAGIKIAVRCKDRFGAYLACGIVTIIAVQVMINVAVVTGSIPPTGLPLPFISYGSTAQAVFMSSIGVLINIDKASKKAALHLGVGGSKTPKSGG